MRKIKLENEQQELLIKKFAEYLKTAKINDKKISFDAEIEKQKIAEKILVTFSAKAYIKMRELVDRASAEIGWYGLIDKLSPTQYRIEDIIVYPQAVTSATVEETNEVWDADASMEDVNRRHFHGHSHVNMSVSPSATDMKHRKDLIENLSDDSFFLLFITNKRCEISAELYDFAENAVYDTDDIAFVVDLDGESTLSDFITEYQGRVKTKVLTPASPIWDVFGKKKKSKTKTQSFNDIVSEDPRMVNESLLKYYEDGWF